MVPIAVKVSVVAVHTSVVVKFMAADVTTQDFLPAKTVVTVTFILFFQLFKMFDLTVSEWNYVGHLYLEVIIIHNYNFQIKTKVTPNVY